MARETVAVMSLLPPLQFAHRLVSDHVSLGDRVIDATIGNGKDALFLTQTIGPEGLLYGFDIQKEALQRTEQYLAQHIDPARILTSYDTEQSELADAVDTFADKQVILMQQSHADMTSFIPPSDHERIASIMFNLGYLPGGDHQLVTMPESTIPALDAALYLLKPGGLLTIMVYPGHPTGQQEAKQVNHWAHHLPQQNFQVLLYQNMNQVNDPPYLIAICKR